MDMRNRTVVALVGALLALFAAVPAALHAADWKPTKPVRFIVGFPPGGATDLVARILQPKLTESLGEQTVVDNRPGANGILSLQILKNAEPDGHTVGMGHFGGLVISPAIQKKARSIPASDCARTSSVMTAPRFTSTPFRNSTAPRYGPMKVPRLLKVWLKVRRKWLLLAGPSAAASGFAAT